MKLNKRTERIITAEMVAALVAYFCYQVAYGTNESSYQFRYKAGREGYDCSDFDADCENGLNACQVGLKIGYNNGVRYIGGDATNQTACYDGFVNGWEHWCNTDLSLCAKYVLSNLFPGQSANNQTSIYLCLRDGNDNATGPDNILSPPQLSKHCGGVISDISGPWIVVRPHPFNPVIPVQNVTKGS